MEENVKEISLSQLWSVCKKSFKKGIIYVLVSVILIGAVLFVIKSVGSTYSTTSTINVGGELSDTTGSTLDYNKTTAVNRALEDFKDGSKKELVHDVLENITITPITPKNLKEDVAFIPSSFNITLKNKDLGLSNDECVDLLGYIAKELLNTFALNELKDFSMSYDLGKELKTKEYFQVANDLSKIVNNLNNKISTIVEDEDKAKQFKGTASKNTFEDIRTDLNTNIETINTIKQFIVNNGVEKKSDGLKKLFTNEIDKLEISANQYKALALDASTKLSNYESNIKGSIKKDATTGETSYLIFDDSTYRALEEAHREYNEKYQSFVAEQDLYTLYKNNITVNASELAQNKEYVETTLKDIYGNISATMSSYTLLAKEYNDTVYKSTNSAIKNPARTIVSTAISTKVIVIVLILVAIVAYFVAYVQTFVKLKKRGFFEEQIDSIKE